ncbi:conjugal transfer protein TrbF [Phenylobacterium sp.]|uniref:conjugal transfer protein TrbF n=1 Tax=Phenylobacterium sp. TaxID=1871053 RepID=UPI002B6C6FF8|nr:conjugal transfer protein TrbF [Phenylobacterium sp.]HVI31049.1 conjugal transfer protein TrbF [Phenylobacterium sp.]
MIPFRRASARYGRAPEPETPYQRAGQAWDERIGSARVQARNWRLMAFGALALAGGSGAALVWTAGKGTVTPWVVEVDRLGEVRAVGPAEAGWRPGDAQVAAQLAQFVRDVRALPADPVVLRENWLRAYDHAAGVAALALNDHAHRSDPFGRLGREQVSVEVASVVRASPDSFRVEWVERRYVDGALAGAERWSAILGVALRPPRDPDALRRNPLGVFVTHLDWSRELS